MFILIIRLSSVENHGCEPIYLEAGQMFDWIYEATVCPGWEVATGGSTDVNTLSHSTSAVPEGLVNMLTASDTNSERHPENNYLGILCKEIHDFWGCLML